MNTIALCVAAAMNIFSSPNGTPVGAVPILQGYPQYEARVLDVSLFKDWVFIGIYGLPNRIVVPLGWVPYAGLTVCPPKAPSPAVQQ